jgi:hypothetical protein
MTCLLLSFLAVSHEQTSQQRLLFRHFSPSPPLKHIHVTIFVKHRGFKRWNFIPSAEALYRQPQWREYFGTFKLDFRGRYWEIVYQSSSRMISTDPPQLRIEVVEFLKSPLWWWKTHRINLYTKTLGKPDALLTALKENSASKT